MHAQRQCVVRHGSEHLARCPTTRRALASAARAPSHFSRRDWQLSRGPVDKCSYFVSHAWGDDGRKKVDMLRSYLSVQQLIARVVVCAVLIAAFSIPLFAALGTVSVEVIELRATYASIKDELSGRMPLAYVQ